MDSLGPIDDEVIADSEGEIEEEEHPGNPDTTNTVSSISEFTLTGQLHDNTPSSISAFTAGPSAFRKQNSIITDNTNTQLIQLSDIDYFVDIPSIADRAKTRQRNSKSSIQSSSTKPNATASAVGRQKQKKNGDLSSDVIELTSGEDDDELALRPLKPKPRPKPKLKVKDTPRDMNNDKTLDHDASGATEISTEKSAHTLPDSRPRPRPRPLRRKTAQESNALPSLNIPGLLPSSSASTSHGPELPIATSPVQPYIHTSQLPPSDPPLPTLTTIPDEHDLPRIETLPNLDIDGPLSSPSSLFSECDSTAKKRKRTAFNEDIDELTSNGDLGFGQEGIRAGAPYEYDNGVAMQVSHMLPPPPTFFAGSSSSSIGGGGRTIQAPSEPTRDLVDLTTLPRTIEPTGAAATKKATKAKISRQKKGDLVAMDEDELDDDFDPTEYNKKGKPKPKSRAKKGTETKAKPDEARAQVEVSIVSKPRTRKTKGKEKATAKNKDSFKSREFVSDSGDQEDPASGGANHSISTATTSKTDDISAGATSIPQAQLEQDTVVSSDDKFSPKTSLSSNRINKKRKSIIDSDPEDDNEGVKDRQAVGTSSKKHNSKRKNNFGKVDSEACDTIYVNPPTARKKPKKGDVSWSGDDNDDSSMEVDSDHPSAGLPEGKKPISKMENATDEKSAKKQKVPGKRSKTKSKKAIEDAGKDENNASMEDYEDVQKQQLAPEAEAVKENVIPSMKSAAKTSRPDDRPKAENSGLFPSLYSRYEIAPRRSSLPMSELIRRANSIPGSPFATPHPRTSSSSTARPINSSASITTYSPYLKSSRSLLSRIAPLHPNRRTPPPQPPRAPPKKKTKKELEMEEKWEEEMIDSVGGTSEWACLGDDEKKELRRAKWAREMGDWDD